MDLGVSLFSFFKNLEYQCIANFSRKNLNSFFFVFECQGLRNHNQEKINRLSQRNRN